MNILNSFLSSLHKHHRDKHPLRVRAIAAVDSDRGIGHNGKLLYHISHDLKYFSEHTKGHAVLMGSETYFSLPKKMQPLPDRLNIVLTRNLNKFNDEDVVAVSSIQDAMAHAENEGYKLLWVIGGGQVYTLAMPFVKKIFLTQIFAKKDADVFFPEFKDDFTLEYTSGRFHDKKNDVEYQFQIWKK